MVNDAYLLIIPYSQHCFLWNFVFYSRKAYLAHQYKKMLCHPYSYRITIYENPIPLQRICVFSYLCLLLTKVLFETSFKPFHYNTEGRRLSNYSVKLILFSHYGSRCEGLCQNKKHEFYQFTKGGHFCTAHMALILIYFCLFSLYLFIHLFFLLIIFFFLLIEFNPLPPWSQTANSLTLLIPNC